jgi:hypothetical protein
LSKDKAIINENETQQIEKDLIDLEKKKEI